MEHHSSRDVYAIKAISKRQIDRTGELRRTLDEQRVLRRMSEDSFISKLWCSFHDEKHVYLAMDFHPGGDLATQLARWGRFGRDRSRFYATEIVSYDHYHFCSPASQHNSDVKSMN